MYKNIPSLSKEIYGRFIGLIEGESTLNKNKKTCR